MGDGGSCLANALRNHPSLAILNLSHNQVQDTGILALSDMLRQNDKLTG